MKIAKSIKKKIIPLTLCITLVMESIPWQEKELKAEEVIQTDSQVEDIYSDWDIYKADSVINGLRVNGEHTSDSMYQTIMDGKPLYAELAEYLIEDDKTVYTSGIWDYWFNEELRKNPKYYYEIILMDYMVYETKSKQFQASLIEDTQKFSYDLLSDVAEEIVKQEQISQEKAMAKLSNMSTREISEWMESVVTFDKYEVLIETMDDVMKICETATDYWEKMGQLLALKNVENDRIQFLKKIKSQVTEDEHLVTAIDEILNCIEMDTEQMVALETGQEIAVLGLEYCWELLCKNAIPQIKATMEAVELGADFCSVLFNTDENSSNNFKLLTIYILEYESKRLLKDLKLAFDDNPTKENAKAFNGAFEQYLHYRRYALGFCDTFIQEGLFEGLYNEIKGWFTDSNVQTYEELAEMLSIQSDSVDKWFETLENIRKVYKKYYGNREKYTEKCLTSLVPIASDRYTGNMGDSGWYDNPQDHYGVDGSVYNNGFVTWIARSGTPEISWASITYDLDDLYMSLSGSTSLIQSYNTTNFDTTLYIYGDDELLYSQVLTDESYEYSFDIDVTGVQELKLMMKDNVAVSGGTNFAIHDLFLLGYGYEQEDDVDKTDDSGIYRVWDGVTRIEVQEKNNTYYIDSAEEMAWLSDMVSSGANDFMGKEVYITGNIDFGGHKLVSIGLINKPFCGNLVIKNCIIRGLSTTTTGSVYADTYAGLFGCVTSDDIEIDNVKIIDGVIDEYGWTAYDGMLFGVLITSGSVSIKNVELSGTVNATKNYANGIVGGVIGFISASGQAKIEFENVITDITCQRAKEMGGLVGKITAGNRTGTQIIVKKCKINSTLSGEECVGGMFGIISTDECVVSECSIEGTIYGGTQTPKVAGLIGHAGCETLKIENVSMLADITADWNCFGNYSREGGLLGYSWCENYADSYIKNCYVAGSLQATGAAFISWNESSSQFIPIVNSYFDENITGCTTIKVTTSYSGNYNFTSNLDAALGYTTQEMYDADNFISWDKEKIWYFSGKDYPVLRCVLDNQKEGKYEYKSWRDKLPKLAEEEAKEFLAFIFNNQEYQKLDLSQDKFYQLLIGDYSQFGTVDELKDAIWAFSTFVRTSINQQVADSTYKVGYLSNELQSMLATRLAGMSEIDDKIISQYTSATEKNITDALEGLLASVIAEHVGIVVTENTFNNIKLGITCYNDMLNSVKKSIEYAENLVAVIEAGWLVLNSEVKGRTMYFNSYLNNRKDYSSSDDDIFQIIMEYNALAISDSTYISNVLNFTTWISGSDSWNNHISELENWAEFLYQLEQSILIDEHNYVETVVEPTCTSKGYTLCNCLSCGREYKKTFIEKIEHIDGDKDGKCDEEGCGSYLDDIGAELAGYTLSLNGNIGVNFYMELASNIVSDYGAYMLFTLPGGNTMQVPVADAKKNTTLVAGKTYYVFSCEVASPQMTQVIKAQMFDGEGKCGTEYTYTVRQYAEYIINHDNYSDESKAFAKALLNYGACAQEYFGISTDDLANKNLIDKTVTNRNYNDLEENYAAPSITDIELGTYVGYVLNLDSETTLKVYFKPVDSVNIDSLKFTVDGQELDKTYAQSGEYIVVSVSNIKAWDLNASYAFVVSDGVNSLTYNCSVMSYCYRVLKNRTSYSKELVNLVLALCDYQEKAEIYAPNNN